MTIRGETVPSISVATLAEWRNDGRAHGLLDIREAAELDVAALEGAMHIPMGEVPARLDELPADAPLVVLCHHGVRSAMMVDYLRRQGIDAAVNLAGGIDAWSREIDPAVPLY